MANRDPRDISTHFAAAAGFFTCVATVLWIVVMAWCGEWPYYDRYHEGGEWGEPIGQHMWFRRWNERFGYVVSMTWSTPCLPSCTTKNRVYSDVDALVSAKVVVCTTSRRQGYTRSASGSDRSDRLQWICPDPAGVAAFMGRVAAVEITALALCPVLAIAIAVHAGLVLVDKSPCAVRGALACVALLGAGIVAALVTCVALLADFNARGLPGLGVGAPAESGWGVAPWWLVSMLVCIVAAVLSSVAATVARRRSPSVVVTVERRRSPPLAEGPDGSATEPPVTVPDADDALPEPVDGPSYGNEAAHAVAVAAPDVTVLTSMTAEAEHRGGAAGAGLAAR